MNEPTIETLARRLDKMERENRRSFHGDGDFADGRRMLEPREEEVKESFGVLDGES